MTQIDEKGYVDLGRRFVHIDVLRDEASVPYIARECGITVERLKEWARGPGLPLGLSWAWDDNPKPPD